MSASGARAGARSARGSLGPVAGGLQAAALAGVGYLAARALFGFEAAGMDPRPVATVALLLGYSVFAGKVAFRSLARWAQEVEGLVSPALLDGVADRVFDPRTHRVTIGGGVLMGVAIAVLDPGTGHGGIRTAHFWRPDLVYWVPTIAILGGLIGGGIGVALRTTRLLVRAGESLPRVDLLRVDRLEPFGRFGLRLSLLWIVGTSLAGLAVLVGRGALLVEVIMAGVVVMALAVLLLPLRGVRRRVQRAKAEELERVNREIERERESVLTREPGSPGARLGELLAWRGYVAEVREWPLDAGSVVRLGLYVAIGLGSWVGAAMVERAVDALLR